MPTPSIPPYYQEKVYPTHKALVLIRCVAAQGISAEAVLSDVGLQPQELKQPDTCISLWQLAKMYLNAINLADAQDLGLRIGQSTTQADYGPYGYAVLTARTTREALYTVREFVELETPIARFNIEEQPDQGIAFIRWDYDMGISELNGFVSDYCLAVTQTYTRMIAGQDFQLLKVYSAQPTPPHHALYQDMFNCECEFNAPKTVLVFSIEQLDRPTMLENAVTHKIMRQQCETAVDELRRKLSLAGQIDLLIHKDPAVYSHFPTMANRLGMSERTLRRRLTAEGLSFKDILDQALFGLAARYLKDDALSVQEVSFKLGYADTSNFRKAFKRWTNQTISAFLES